MLITIYIPTKNRLELLTAAVDSVLAQTHRELELIVVDDGSTDDTPAYLAATAERDPRVRFLRHEQSQGGPTARNAAIRAARGEFVTGLDDDDTFQPDRLERFAAEWRRLAAQGETPAFLYSQLREIQHGQHVGSTQRPAVATFEDMFRENVVGNQVFAPKQHFIEAGLFRPDLPAWQDLEFFMRMMKTLGRARLVDHDSYNFENTPRSDRITSKGNDKVRRAFRMVDEAHGGGQDGRQRQRLFLQQFARIYGIRPTLADYQWFLGQGFWPTGMKRLLKASLRP